MCCLKNEQKCIIRFKKSRRSQEFLHLIIHDCEFLKFITAAPKRNLNNLLKHNELFFMNTNYTMLIAAHAMNLDSIGNNMR